MNSLERYKINYTQENADTLIKENTDTFIKENADTFIKENKYLLDPTYRLNYHLMSEYGWMNDPNGFIQYRDQYHLFYQHYPYQPKWGPMHWGHAVSHDLIKWKYSPVAMAPDQEYDSGGCFSGSAVEKDGRLFLMYTGHVVTGPDISKDYYQTQCIAVSDDGIHFDKWANNPVIDLSQIPADVSQKDFRDPKVFERNGYYYVVLGSNDGEGNGLILLYRSDDLVHWHFIGILAQSDGQLGDNWECPDLIQLQDHDVLIFSPQNMPAQGHEYCNLHSTMYMLGKLDTDNGSFAFDDYHQVDHGFDFYAPQSMLDHRGRRIIIGWMDMWETDMPTQQGHNWAGAMSLPREIVLKGERLVFRPVEEVASYRSNPYATGSILLEGEKDMGVSGDSYEIIVVFEANKAKEFGLKLRVSDTEETVLSYRPNEKLFRFNRDRAGIGPKGERAAEVELEGGKLTLRIFVDRSSVEVFIQDGEKVMSGRVYPGQDALGIKAYSHGNCVIESFRMWNII